MFAITGAIEIIKSNKPILAIAIYHNANDFFEIKAFLEDLNLGYNFKIIKLSIFHPTDEVYLLARPNGD